MADGVVAEVLAQHKVIFEGRLDVDVAGHAGGLVEEPPGVLDVFEHVAQHDEIEVIIFVGHGIPVVDPAFDEGGDVLLAGELDTRFGDFEAR